MNIDEITSAYKKELVAISEIKHFHTILKNWMVLRLATYDDGSELGTVECNEINMYTGKNQLAFTFYHSQIARCNTAETE